MADKAEQQSEGKCAEADIIRGLQERVDELEASVAAHQGVATKAANAHRDFAAAVLAQVDPEAELAPLNEDESTSAHTDRLGSEALLNIRSMILERDRAQRSLRAQKGATTKAKNTIEQMEEAAKPRKFGAGETGGDVRALEQLIEEADEVVLAFSDGRSEIAGVPACRVSADDFVIKRGRLLYQGEGLTVTGPNTAASAPELAGVALVLDGEQVAWSPLSRPLALGANQTTNLTGSVIFG